MAIAKTCLPGSQQGKKVDSVPFVRIDKYSQSGTFMPREGWGGHSSDASL